MDIKELNDSQDRERLTHMFNDYLVMAEGNRKIALNFFMDLWEDEIRDIKNYEEFLGRLLNEY